MVPRPLLILPLAALAACSDGELGGFVEGKDYLVLERVRFLDTAGFEQPAEAFSVLLPRGWKHQGGILWKSLQECRSEMVSAAWTSTSPTGDIRFQALPNHAWQWASDPMMLQHLQNQAHRGGCEVGGPLSAEQYLRQVMLAREWRGATVTGLRENPEAVAELERKAAASQAKYARPGTRYLTDASALVARLAWPDGSEGIALVSLINIDARMRNQYTGAPQRLTTSVTQERSLIRFPPARRAEAEALLANLKSSYRTNPQWQAAVERYSDQLRRDQDRQHHQRMKAIADMSAASARAHQQRMADIQRQGAANTQRHQERMAAMDSQMRSWEARQSSQDRSHSAFVQSIREVETWQGDGGQVELSSGYNQAWSRGDGTYVLSNSANFDPRTAFQDQSWQELQRAR